MTAALARRDDAGAEAWLQEYRTRARDAGHETYEADWLSHLGRMCLGAGYPPVARPFIEESLALTRDGSVWAWGRTGLRREARGSGGEAVSPPQLVLSGGRAVGATLYGSLVLKDDGTVWGWGSNSEGQLCDGTTEDKPAPVQCEGLSNVIGIAAASTNGKAIIG